MGRLVALIASFALTAGLAVGCFVSSFDVLEAPLSSGGSGPGGAPSGGSATAGGGTAGAGACQHAIWPAAPESSDGGATEIEVLVAARTVDFDEQSIEDGLGATRGYDLDDHCTCQGQESSCVVPEWATADHCDGPAGRDNAFASIVHSVQPLSSAVSSEGFSESIGLGRFTLLARISRYNGEPDDRSVTVALYPSGGLKNDPCFSSAHLPAWDGADPWPVPSNALEGSVDLDAGLPADCDAGASAPNPALESPRYVDENAYVTGGVVVANVPELEIIMTALTDAASFKLTASFLTGRLELDPVTSRWVMRDGLLVGRVRLSDVFASLAVLISDGSQLCTDHAYYDPMKTLVCRHADIVASLGGPTTPCDAISFGMGFEAEQARLGIVYESPPLPDPCPPETDPALDQCGAGGSG